MAKPEHLAKLKEGVNAWNEWRKANPSLVPDLRGAHLRGENLREIDLRGARIDGADLSWANLISAHLDRADFTKANFDWAKLTFAELGGTNLSFAHLTLTELDETNLSGATLEGASLAGVNLRGARLANADFSGASIYLLVFSNNDLSTTRGLETVLHDGPSTIGIDTIYRSQGKIPPSFLRGAGVPEIFIEYLPSLVASGAIQFYSCFISYSTKDQEFADRLYADLQNKGVRCWFAPHDVQGGKKLHEQIDEAIRRYERLLLILSPNGMSSKWVRAEIRNARKREVEEKKRLLFPVRLASYEALRDWKLFDADEGEDLATEIREYYIPDFSEWKNHDSYVKELNKLLRDLRTEDSKSG